MSLFRGWGGSVSGHLSDNLEVLARRAPAVAQAIADASGTGVELRTSADGTAILVGSGGPLHNTHAPLAEARRWVGEQLEVPERSDAETLIVVGFGAGYHLDALAAVSAGRIVVVEPSADVLRAALVLRDCRALLARVDVRTDAPTDAELDTYGRAAVLRFAPAMANDRVGGREVAQTVQGRVGRRQVRLKILVVSPLHGGTLPMTGYVARALAGLGHAVSILDVSPFDGGYQQISAFGATGPRRHALEGRFVDFLAEGVLRRVEYEQPDLVLALAQAPLTSPLLAQLQEAGVKTALWFAEDFRRFPYWEDVGPHYRYVFGIQRGECMAAFAAAGITNAWYLPCAADPGIHAPMSLSEAEQAEFGSAVSFVGAGYRNRRVAFRRLLDFDFKVWGSDWRGADGIAGRVLQRHGARVSPTDTVRIFNASTINVNLHSSTYVDGVDPLGDFVNPRTFELAACGAFQLVDERRHLPEVLVPGREVATFASTAELRDRIAYYLERPAERDAIAAAGRRRVLAEHTYAARMTELLERVLGCDYDDFLLPRAQTHGTGALVNAAGADTALGRYLQRTCGGLPDVNLDDVAVQIRLGQGPLAEEEEIFLFLKQYDDMFLAAYRP
jgi:spore maturation protein CgeB